MDHDLNAHGTSYDHGYANTVQVYLEAYTAILMVDVAKLVLVCVRRLYSPLLQSEFYGREVIVADREQV